MKKIETLQDVSDFVEKVNSVSIDNINDLFKQLEIKKQNGENVDKQFEMLENFKKMKTIFNSN
ncbi:gp112 [Bacillus phage G]|uniref:Gp112 n=1 Tax=Bacillus phage G TaxID=2884420 RepID=G3MBH4_9CAUD|nr:gp112 [Bacillus phage G]AEO93374.1 gp112 [Bacillus phage G]